MENIWDLRKKSALFLKRISFASCTSLLGIFMLYCLFFIGQ